MKRFRTFRWGGSYGRVGFVFALALAAVVWLLGGFGDGLGAVPHAEAQTQKITSLTLKYHDFGLGSSVSVELLKDTKKGELVGGPTINTSHLGTFTVQKKAAAKRVGSKVELKLGGSTIIKIHTSCSQPIAVGFVYADDNDDGAEATSIGAFNSSGFTAALEITQILPVGACGNVTPTPTPTSTPTSTPTPSTAPNLTLTKVDVPDPVNFGDTLSYLLTVGNNGNAATSGTVTVKDTIPASTTFVSAAGTGWSCSQASGVVTCTRSDTLLAGSSYPAITLVVNAPATCGSITNTVQVSGGSDPGADPDATASQSTSVINCPGAATPTPQALPAALPASGVGPSSSPSSGLSLPLAAGLALALAALVGWSAWRFDYSKRGQA